MNFVAEQAGQAPAWIGEGVILTHSNSAVMTDLTDH